MNIVLLDKETLAPQNGYQEPLDLSGFAALGNFTAYDKTLPSQTIERIKKADIVLTNKVVLNKPVLDEARALKMIAIAATGMNNIDVEYAKSLGIVVQNVAGYSTISVAQHTMAMVFHLLHDMKGLSDYVRSGRWHKSELFTFWSKPFTQLCGKKWGIIGYGAIGQQVAQLAAPFGVEIITHSPSGRVYDTPYKQLGLTPLLKQCPIISIHSPLNEYTRHLIGTKELEQLQEGAILINVARGGIINEQELASMIDKREIFVGLDVLEQEPITIDHPLLSVQHPERLLITPHNAWASVEARKELLRKVYDHVKSFCSP